MTWLSLCLPLILGVHNMIDFRDSGANEEYATYLGHTVTQFVEMIEDNNPNVRLVNHSGHMDTKIHSITLNFEANEEQTIDEARDMVLGLLDSFLAALNHGCCGRLPPYLCPNPFTPDNVDIEVHFVGDCLYNYPKPRSIQYVVFSGGKIGYFTQNFAQRGFLGEKIGYSVCDGGVNQIRSEPLAFARHLAHPPTILDCSTFPHICRPETLSEFWERLDREKHHHSLENSL